MYEVVFFSNSLKNILMVYKKINFKVSLKENIWKQEMIRRIIPEKPLKCYWILESAGFARADF